MKGQIWIETTLYTLIGLALIGMVLAFALPKISSAQEKTIIDQTIFSLEEMDSKIMEVLNSASGNSRTYEITFKKGRLSVDASADKITFVLDDMTDAYSQVDALIKNGIVDIVTKKNQKSYSTHLTLDYNNVTDLKIGGQQEKKEYSPAPTPYRFIISNEGMPTTGGRLIVLNIDENS